MKKFERGESMSTKILSGLRHEVSSSMSFLAFINEEVTKSYDDLVQTRRNLEVMLASGKASDKDISALKADLALKERCCDDKSKYSKYAETLLDNACAELIEYAIDICVPEQYRKDATTDYVSGNKTIDIFWGKNNANHCVLDLYTKKIKHIKTQQS